MRHFKHQACMNGRKFIKDKEVYEILRGDKEFVGEVLKNVIYFRNLQRGITYVMEEQLFFSKIDYMDIWNDQRPIDRMLK